MNQFKQSFMNAMNDEKQKQKILDMVKTMTPNFNDQERDKLFHLSIQAMSGQPSGNVESQQLPITPVQAYKNDLRRQLTLAELPLNILMMERHKYYATISIDIPENYEPRIDVSQWDAIDLFETAYILHQNEGNRHYRALLEKYKTWLKSKIE